MDIQRVAFFTNEYPPHVYGGAGVHVEYLSAALAQLVEVEVRCFGEQHETQPNLCVRGYQAWTALEEAGDAHSASILKTLSRNLAMLQNNPTVQIVHSHTWYTQLAGFLAGKLWKVPTVLTTHSLEPLRPWKAEQLGSAYALSSWMERTAIEAADAVIAVSQETRSDVLNHFAVDPQRVHVIHNGIDPHQYHPVRETTVLERYGIDPAQPYVLFVGRITRQKGIIHLVEAIPQIDPTIQVVLAAGAPDTPAIAAEMDEQVARARSKRDGIVWINEMLSRDEAIQLYSHARVFCCPSVYEPFGIINLEAMACQTAVVASRIGGIPEVVVPEETGVLVDCELKEGTFTPVDSAKYAHDLAAAINRIALNEGLAAQMGTAGRQRAEKEFSWQTIARRTLQLYASLL